MSALIVTRACYPCADAWHPALFWESASRSPKTFPKARLILAQGVLPVGKSGRKLVLCKAAGAMISSFSPGDSFHFIGFTSQLLRLALVGGRGTVPAKLLVLFRGRFGGVGAVG
jgi:hypothetical protein